MRTSSSLFYQRKRESEGTEGNSGDICARRVTAWAVIPFMGMVFRHIEIRQKGNALLLVRLSLCRYIFFYLDVNIF